MKVFTLEMNLQNTEGGGEIVLSHSPFSFNLQSSTLCTGFVNSDNETMVSKVSNFGIVVLVVNYLQNCLRL